ncbi:phage tail sheath C-terminal domain-containing protein [Nguyenibacter vanlangensis]|uniref:Phage tail sheath C-terminal domain-containing protein n=1 Tax=Nguyenibacter vanlangensis TaxID=1216886 RepID=A0ABZ3D201_9PROT
MANNFLHGAEVQTVSDGDTSVQVTSTSIIGIVGTAPFADPTQFPLNTPVLVNGNNTALIGALIANAQATDIDVGTLPQAIADMLDELTPAVVVVRVQAVSTNGAQTPASYDPATIPNVVGGLDANGNALGVHVLLNAESVTGYRPRLLCAPGWTHQTTAGAVLNVAATQGGSGYTPGTYQLVLTGAGTGAVVNAVVDAGGAVSSVAVTENGSGYAASGTTAAMPAAAGAGTSPAEFTISVGNTDNPVIAELSGIAQRLGAVIYADGPNVSDAAAISAAGQGGQRVMMIDPWMIKLNRAGVMTAFPQSAKWAAKQAYVDNTIGWWASVSNKPLNGILALARPVSFTLGDESCSANLLNGAYVSTVIRASAGFKTWGNRALDGSFLCVTRTVDIVNASLLASALQFVDDGVTTNFVDEVVGSVNAFLRQLKSLGAITGGKCWADTALNTPQSVMNGQTYFDFDIGPVYPAERITFRSSINNNYITTIFGNGSNS